MRVSCVVRTWVRNVVEMLASEVGLFMLTTHAVAIDDGSLGLNSFLMMT